MGGKIVKVSETCKKKNGNRCGNGVQTNAYSDIDNMAYFDIASVI